MKKLILLAKGAAMITIVGVTAAYAQPESECASEEFSQNCALSLGEYRYVRTYDGIPKAEVSDYPTTNAYLFSKGTSYLITACDNKKEGTRIVLNLYNQMRRLIASNYNEEKGQYFNKIVYNCVATGIFYIQPIVEDDKGGCGVSVIGFKKL